MNDVKKVLEETATKIEKMDPSIARKVREVSKQVSTQTTSTTPQSTAALREDLVRFANYLDSIGRIKDADVIDQFLQKTSGYFEDVCKSYLKKVQKAWKDFCNNEITLDDIIEKFKTITQAIQIVYDSFRERKEDLNEKAKKEKEEEEISEEELAEKLEAIYQSSVQLVKIANDLDDKHLFEQSDEIDKVLKQLSMRVGLYHVYQIAKKLERKNERLAKKLKNIIRKAFTMYEITESGEGIDWLGKTVKEFEERAKGKPTAEVKQIFLQMFPGISRDLIDNVIKRIKDPELQAIVRDIY